MLFRGALVVTTDRVQRTDVRVADERIVEVAPGLRPSGDGVTDLDGLHLFPGAVDPHVHQWEPGFASAPDFEDATGSAAVGGVTTLLDHPLSPPVVVDATTFASKVALGERTAVVDFGLHGGTDPAHLENLAGLWAAGATGIKLFTCPTGTELGDFDDARTLRIAFDRLAALGALVLVHAEDAGTLDRNRTALWERGEDARKRRGRAVAEDYASWHSLEAEQLAVDHVLALAAGAGTAAYIVHASHPGIVDRVREIAARGATAYAETCPHYLQLDDSDLGTLGGWAMTAPPVRGAGARAGLVERLADGQIDAVGSDHCAVAAAGKEVPAMDALVPGVPGLDLFLPLIIDVAVRNDIDLTRVAGVTAEAPARIFGLGSKGAIAVGRDADFAVIDLNATVQVRGANLPSSAGWTPYEGRSLRGAVVQTWSRGELVAQAGRPVGRPGRGRFIPRQEES
jgi:allantoinase